MSADDAVEEKSRRRRRRGDDNDDDDSSLTESKGRATRSRRGARGGRPENEGNALTRTFGGVIGYLQGVRDELDKVVWPTREETIRLSRIVLAVTIASSLAFGAISVVFTEMFVIGVREDNPWIFLVFAAAVVVVFFFARQWWQENDSNTPY
jgi:preprotein translocase subunit SecE